jgi:hypothetical protein
MGLFFDQDWFDAKLRSAGLTRGSLAQAAGMTIDEVEMVFADRRELEGREVSAIARVLRVDPQEVSQRSGAAEIGGESSFDRMEMNVPVRPIREGGEFQVTREVINGIHERLDRLERMLELVLTKLDRR